MQTEAADVGVECVDGARAARVGDPGADRDRRGHLGDGSVGHAQDDEVGVADLQPASGQARGERLGESCRDRGADTTCADD